jgi:TolA-binding protein
MNKKLWLVLAPALILMAFYSCGERKDKELYEAEKALFEAKKMKSEAFSVALKAEFYEKTLNSYRRLINTYQGSIDHVDGLRRIVVSAYIDVADLEFRAGNFQNAREDFIKAADLASSIPEARANAIYSAAVISEELQDSKQAVALFAKFFDEFLSEDSLLETASMNTRYLITPLKIAGIEQKRGNEKEAFRWLVESKNIYEYMAKNSEDPAVIKEMDFNLLTVYLQGRQWRKAMIKVQELKSKYAESEMDATSLLYLEAMIQRDGFGNTGKAAAIFQQVYEKFPQSKEASSALLAAANIYFIQRDYAKAKTLYRELISKYGDSQFEAAEAAWQVAKIFELEGNWAEASLQYSSIYTNYPNTLQGLEAPIAIANHFRDRGEKEAASAAYMKAVEHYGRIISGGASEGMTLMAEEYIVRCFAEQEEWQEAANRLIELPHRYPFYRRFRENYLMAASIYERELGDADKAAEILGLCVEKYPGTDVALEAEKQLKRLKD